MPANPTHAIVAVTERCNARCDMCDIWKKKASKEMPPEFYERLPRSLVEINVTGGEPLLRDDLGLVIRAMRKAAPRARIVLSTNGLLPERLEDLLRTDPDIAVRVSIDAIGDLHDRIRGVKGAYEKALESIRVARRLGVRDLGISATMSRYNVGGVAEVQEFAISNNLNFTVTTTHSSDVFFGNQRAKQPESGPAIRELEKIQRRFMSSTRIKDWFKGYFVGGLIDVLKGQPRPISCRAGSDFFYLDPEGNVYPCHLWDSSMGNLNDQKYEDIIAANQSTLEQVARCTKKCWMTCTVAPEMRRKLPEYAFKVLLAKVRHHLGSGTRR